MANKLRRFRNRKPSPTDLTWEEKNPIDYLYRPSEAIERLKEKVESNKKSSSTSNEQKQQED